MHEQGVDLRARLEAFRFDDGPARFGFADRLAKENGWSSEFAHRAMREYLRFMYLAATAGHPVTPSEEVDQVWHLHMIYTRSYWERLCGQLLGQAIHHEPTRGGRAEGEKFVDWYERTKESYRRCFGEAPPGDLWPNVSHRFEDAYARIDRRTHWTIEKRAAKRGTLWSMLGVGVLAIAGCATALAQTPRSGTADLAILGVVLCGGLVLVLVLAFVAARARSKHGQMFQGDRRPRRDVGTGGCGAGMMLGGLPSTHGTAPAPGGDGAHHHHHGHGSHSHDHGSHHHGDAACGGHGASDAGGSDSGGHSGCGSGGDGGGTGCGGSSSGCGSGGGCGSSS